MQMTNRVSAASHAIPRDAMVQSQERQERVCLNVCHSYPSISIFIWLDIVVSRSATSCSMFDHHRLLPQPLSLS
jgi:hypothetical protein